VGRFVIGLFLLFLWAKKMPKMKWTKKEEEKTETAAVERK